MNHTSNHHSDQGISLGRWNGRQVWSIFGIIIVLLIITTVNPAQAQQHSYDPNTDNDGGQQFGDCLKDINKYCKAWAPLLFELENCLQSHIAHLTPACRSHMENTDFRKYHRDEPLSPDL